MQVGGHLAKLSLESLGRLRDSISSGKVGPELQALARATGTGAPALLVDQGVREQVQQRCQDQGLPGYGSAPRSVQNLTEGGLKAGATLGHQASLSAFIQDTSVPIEKRILGFMEHLEQVNERDIAARTAELNHPNARIADQSIPIEQRILGVVEHLQQVGERDIAKKQTRLDVALVRQAPPGASLTLDDFASRGGGPLNLDRVMLLDHLGRALIRGDKKAAQEMVPDEPRSNWRALGARLISVAASLGTASA